MSYKYEQIAHKLFKTYFFILMIYKTWAYVTIDFVFKSHLTSVQITRKFKPVLNYLNLLVIAKSNLILYATYSS